MVLVYQDKSLITCIAVLSVRRRQLLSSPELSRHMVEALPRYVAPETAGQNSHGAIIRGLHASPPALHCSTLGVWSPGANSAFWLRVAAQWPLSPTQHGTESPPHPGTQPRLLQVLQGHSLTCPSEEASKVASLIPTLQPA